MDTKTAATNIILHWHEWILSGSLNRPTNQQDVAHLLDEVSLKFEIMNDSLCCSVKKGWTHHPYEIEQPWPSFCCKANKHLRKPALIVREAKPRRLKKDHQKMQKGTVFRYDRTERNYMHSFSQRKVNMYYNSTASNDWFNLIKISLLWQIVEEYCKLKFYTVNRNARNKLHNDPYTLQIWQDVKQHGLPIKHGLSVL